MKIGYARVSTVGQDLETQQEILQDKGCEKIFVEKRTGTNIKEREGIQQAMDFAREGDMLYVTKIDRLARSIIDLNKIVHELVGKGISVYFINENMSFSSERDNNSLQTLMFNILGSFAQFERDMIVERTSEGRERARQQGKHLGRPSKPIQNIKRALDLYRDRQSNGMSIQDIVKVTDVPKSTLYHKLKETDKK